MIDQSPTICIYHANCNDGFGAAWAVHKAFPDNNIRYIAAQYNDEPPDVTDERVAIVDFSYKRPVLERMAQQACDILVLDHHATAKDDLLPMMSTSEPIDTRIRGVFDMDHSGAVLTWNWFHDAPVPRLLRYVQDRDLWKFELNGSREISAWINSYPRDFESWDYMDSQLFQRGTENGIPPTLFSQGAAILRTQERIIEAAVRYKHAMHIDNLRVPVAHTTTLFSEVSNRLCEEDPGAPFAASYFMANEGRRIVFSLRSLKDGADVSEIAKQFGGGGHPHAAGFSIGITEFIEMLE